MVSGDTMNKQNRKEWPSSSKERKRQYDIINRKNHPEKWMLKRTKARAAKRGVIFDLSREDIIIPEYCPALGVKLEQGRNCKQPNSPSLDRIIPSKGYVKGNVAVISLRANQIKNDASVEDLQKVLDWLKKTIDGQ
jgi:hypothetical protein